eukprot:scaffold129330_cov24-Tisochrysis_lutea.AAC.1
MRHVSREKVAEGRACSRAPTHASRRRLVPHLTRPITSSLLGQKVWHDVVHDAVNVEGARERVLGL